MVVPPLPVKVAQAQGQMASHLKKEDVSKVEIFWTLQTFTAHNSYKSDTFFAEIFKAMFPNSQIAAKLM